MTHPLDDIFDPFYQPDERDRNIFGERYCPPDKFEYGKWHTVARFEKEWGDGQAAEIDECRMPARFFRLRVLQGPNSIGEVKPAFALSTGSGDEMGRLMVTLAKAVSAGMVGLHMEVEDA